MKKAVSLKKKLKGVEWHRRQSEREKQVKVVKAAQPCKFYIHGSCRAVSRGRGGEGRGGEREVCDVLREGRGEGGV